MNKDCLRNTMLALEAADLLTARQAYADYLKGAMLDRFERIENDERAQAIIASSMAEAFDQPAHSAEEKIAKLKTIDFGPKTEVEEGAVVTFSGRHLVISVATQRFVCEGEEFIGISPAAPIYTALEGKKKGESCDFRGKKIVIDDVQ